MSDATRQTGEKPSPPPGERQGYAPPAILWEEEYVALAQTGSNIELPPCYPGQDPSSGCTP